jgi:hypothetical protein
VITLAELEREVARRTGPYFQAAQAAGEPTSSTATSAIMPALQSTALVGGPENLWLLRRGVLADGTPTPAPISADDRQRVVQSFDSGAGRVNIDRNWGTPMYPSELAEFIHLAPDQELRAAVLAGLRRCFIEEVLSVEPDGTYDNVDITDQFTWLTDPSLVMRVQYGATRPFGDMPFTAYAQAGHVLVSGTWGGYSPSGFWVTALRPAWTWVNGAESTTGPTADDDELDVDLDYAAAAGHIEAWHLFPSRMIAAAAGGLQATQEMAAREFTRQATIWGPVAPRNLAFSSIFGGTSGVVINR